jgi:hypothetical protein
MRERRIEAEQIRHALAVEREVGACHDRGPGRRTVDALIEGKQPLRIARKDLLEHGQPVGEGRRLCVLAMGVAWHHRLTVMFGEVEQCAA